MESKDEHLNELLTVMMEECAEVIVECSKVQRFGAMAEYDGDYAIDRLQKELGDLLCMINLLKKTDLIEQYNLDRFAAEKYQKLKKWSNLIEK